MENSIKSISTINPAIMEIRNARSLKHVARNPKPLWYLLYVQYYCTAWWSIPISCKIIVFFLILVFLLFLVIIIILVNSLVPLQKKEYHKYYFHKCHTHLLMKSLYMCQQSLYLPMLTLLHSVTDREEYGGLFATMEIWITQSRQHTPLWKGEQAITLLFSSV